MENNNSTQKNNISVGLIINGNELHSNPIFPNEIKDEILDAPYYLLIFISREDVVKISCFPTQNNNIKKILIKLKEFSPKLVKGISSVLNELNLSSNIMHTTGLCYEMEKCFYETYLTGDLIDSGELTVDSIKDKFLSVDNVLSVNVEDITSL
ncbi:hypothetical protein LCGC14_1557020 [marine sediment metagenome]|uniref:Uncharacterized protein n=1 Tax=marine sediment metagenome TaxID=412755 RepID=A0A0F9LPI9_9ZZZZ|nr:MAG: hypothetical protein Lokiarch_31730 [Candidatus Lokiarchaeum sp. GC14_75]